MNGPPASRALRRAGCLAAAALFAVVALPASGGEYRRAAPGYRYAFPRDHGAHPDFRTEWWYYTGHLAAEDGRRFGYQLTFFRSGVEQRGANPSRWAARNLYLAHFAVSDVKKGKLHLGERLGREGLGEAGADAAGLEVRIGDWEAVGEGTGQRLRAREGAFAIELRLELVKPPVINGENGISQKAEGAGYASHYYSITRLKTAGTLTADGRSLMVTGQSWMDHEFGSSQLREYQVGWDWFSLQLDNQAELMLYQLRHRDGKTDPYSSGTLVHPDGRAEHLRREDFAIEVLEAWKSPHSGGAYPMRWRVRVPKAGIDVTVTPAFPDQELVTAKSTRVTYWEGTSRVEGTMAGRPVRGDAYVEMTGYAHPFQKRI
ncbi:MAG TPA: lipocalin-like domain-containing protein [Candidatus Sulfotelmatobacter sp.]|nr:lipocalin-like domain-containing protein [Candidatus Sulfotelmatobacter sp.]